MNLIPEQTRPKVDIMVLIVLSGWEDSSQVSNDIGHLREKRKLIVVLDGTFYSVIVTKQTESSTVDRNQSYE